MGVLQGYRKFIFWSYDFLTGGKILRFYREVEEVIEKPQSQLSKSKKEEYIAEILDHATSTVGFYEKQKGYSSILSFPIINKNSIRDNFNSFKSSKFKEKNCIKVSTSGSTGAPFSVLQNKNKRKRNIADVLYFSQKAGYEFGHKLVYVKIWPNDIKLKVLSKLYLFNIFPQSVFNLRDIDIDLFVKKLVADKSKKGFLGYSSAFERICKYLDSINSGPINCNGHSIITMSEALNEYTRDRMNKYFGVIPLSRYSNNENGILAQEITSENRIFTINSASYYVEILNIEKDELVDNGIPGRIVVTDLHNYAMPMIRYDTGDIGVMNTDKNGTSFIQSIEGRKLDLIYNTKGDLVPSHVSYKLCKYGDYKQFQLVQFGQKEYLIRLNIDTKVDEEKIKEEYKGYFGSDAKITIEYVDDIPLLSSGKRKEVTNTYHSQFQ